MDSVLRCWLQACPDRELILSVADKMGWSTGADVEFRRVMEARSLAEETQENETSVAAKADEKNEDDGFQAVSLTAPAEN